MHRTCCYRLPHTSVSHRASAVIVLSIDRHVKFVNFYPYSKVPDDVKRHRLKAFNRGKATNHWVQIFMSPFDPNPVRDYEPPVLCEVGQKMVGFTQKRSNRRIKRYVR